MLRLFMLLVLTGCGLAAPPDQRQDQPEDRLLYEAALCKAFREVPVLVSHFPVQPHHGFLDDARLRPALATLRDFGLEPGDASRFSEAVEDLGRNNKLLLPLLSAPDSPCYALTDYPPFTYRMDDVTPVRVSRPGFSADGMIALVTIDFPGQSSRTGSEYCAVLARQPNGWRLLRLRPIAIS